jgi:hypothetical protein
MKYAQVEYGSQELAALYLLQIVLKFRIIGIGYYENKAELEIAKGIGRAKYFNI